MSKQRDGWEFAQLERERDAALARLAQVELERDILQGVVEDADAALAAAETEATEREERIVAVLDHHAAIHAAREVKSQQVLDLISAVSAACAVLVADPAVEETVERCPGCGDAGWPSSDLCTRCQEARAAEETR